MIGRRAGLVWAGALAAAACSPSSPAAGGPPGWHVAGGALRDPQGRTVVLRGANVSGMNKQKPYLDFQQQADFDRMRQDWGMNSMRFLLVWAAVEPQEGVYDDAYLDAVGQRLTWAEQAGVLAVLDMHQDLFGEGFAGGDGAPLWACDASRYAAFTPTDPWFYGYLDPNVGYCVDQVYVNAKLQDDYVAMWRHVAERLSSHANVVGFDPMNEPAWGTYAMNAYEADRLQPFYERVVPAVRAAAPSWVAFLEPGASRNLGQPTRLAPFPFADVVYAPHSYDRDAESGAAFDPSHRQSVLDNAAALRAEATMLGAALWVGEYGAPSGEANVSDYMNAECDAFAAVGAGSAYWDFSKNDTGYGLLDAAGNEKPALLGAIVRPYPARVAGDLQSYAYDAGTRTLTVTYVPDAAVTAPTEIVVPPRVYPGGVTVDCGGCTSDTEPGWVHVRTPPAASPAVVTVRPR